MMVLNTVRDDVRIEPWLQSRARFGIIGGEALLLVI